MNRKQKGATQETTRKHIENTKGPPETPTENRKGPHRKQQGSNDDENHNERIHTERGHTERDHPHDEATTTKTATPTTTTTTTKTTMG